MKAYIAWLGEYVSRVLLRLDTGAGIALGIGFFFVLFAAGGVGATLSAQISVGITLVLLLEATYGVFRKERQMRAERETRVRLVAHPVRYALNVTSERQLSLDAQVHWEIWADDSVWTDQIALIVSVIESQERLLFFRKTIVNPLVRIPPDVDPEVNVDSWHRDHFTYRHLLTRESQQPLKGSARFYIQDFLTDGEPPVEAILLGGKRLAAVIREKRKRWPGLRWRRRGFLDYRFELVLKIGSPQGVYRTSVVMDHVRGAALAREVS